MQPEKQLPAAKKGKESELLKKYFERHFEVGHIFKPPSDPQQGQAPTSRSFGRSFKNFVRFLYLLPYLCLAVFIGSFFLDFGPDDAIQVFGYTIPLTGLARTISVGGLIGYGTNWLAINMLFRPLERRPIWGQGLIPAQKDRIIYQLAGGIHRHILSEELIRRRIQESGIIPRVNKLLIDGAEELLHDDEFRNDLKSFVHLHVRENMEKPEVREKITQAIDEKLKENLKSGFKGFMFNTYKSLRPFEYKNMISNLLDRVPDTVVEIINELEQETDKLTNFLKEKEKDIEQFYFRLVQEILERIDIHKLLSKQMSHLDEAGIEKMIRGATNQQLLYIQYLGTLLGIFGGLLIWNPIPMLIIYATLLGILFLLDQVLFRIRQKKHTP